LAATKIRAQVQRFRNFGVSKSIGLSPEKRDYCLLYLLQSHFGLRPLVHHGPLESYESFGVEWSPDRLAIGEQLGPGIILASSNTIATFICA
jgi:hypothetical protein